MDSDGSELQRERAQSVVVSVCAATLTYNVAPFPADDDINAQLSESLSIEADRQRAANADATLAGRWLSRAWEGVKSLAQENVVGLRQSEFLRHFSRQLEVNAEEFEVVMMSCRCDLISMGIPVPGLLFVTNWGFYFLSNEAAATEATRAATPTARRRASVQSKTSPPRQQPCSDTAIKERVDFARVASLLPSVAQEEMAPSAPVPTTNCASSGSDNPYYYYFQGVPSPHVMPTALQVFTVRAHQIYQFINILDVVFKPPTPTAATAVSESAASPAALPVEPSSRVRDPEAHPAFHDVIKTTEFPLFKAMPMHLDTFKATAIFWRLWRSKLEALNLPLLNPFVAYAEPH